MSDVIRRSLSKVVPQDKVFDAVVEQFRDDATVIDDGDALILKGVYKGFCAWEATVRLVTRDDRLRLVADVACTWSPLFWLSVAILFMVTCAGAAVPFLQYGWFKGKLLTLIEQRLDNVVDDLG